MADKGRKNGPMRLDRFLAEMGYGTRTQVKDMVKKGRVRMNGEAVKDADRKVNPESDIVEVDRSRVAYARMEYYMLNKPQGVVSATEDRKYPTVVGLIREALRKDLFPVGRLTLTRRDFFSSPTTGSWPTICCRLKSMWIRYIWPMCQEGCRRMP